MKKYLIIVLILLSSKIWCQIQSERWEYDIKFGMIKAGTGYMQITNEVYNDSIPVYKILFKAKTNSFFDTFYKVRDKIISWWDKENLVPLEFSKELREGTYKQRRTHYYFHDQKFSMYYYFSFKKQLLKEKRVDILQDTQDILTAFYHIREQELKVGDVYQSEITIDGKSFTADIAVLKKEKIKTKLGKKNCFIIEPKLAGDAVFRQKGNIFIWITADNDRIPVKVQSKISYGSFYAKITDRKIL